MASLYELYGQDAYDIFQVRTKPERTNTGLVISDDKKISLIELTHSCLCASKFYYDKSTKTILEYSGQIWNYPDSSHSDLVKKENATLLSQIQ